jgi:hypothetical protein
MVGGPPDSFWFRLKVFSNLPFSILGPTAVGSRNPKKANYLKGWDAKLLAYILGNRDTEAGLPGAQYLLGLRTAARLFAMTLHKERFLPLPLSLLTIHRALTLHR